MRRKLARGSALLYALIMATLVSVLSFTALGYARSATTVSGTQVARAQLRGLAECGLTTAVHDLWDKYLASKGGQPGRASVYAAWLAAQSIGGTPITPADAPGVASYMLARSASPVNLGTSTGAGTLAKLTVLLDLSQTKSSSGLVNAVYLKITSTATTVDGRTQSSLVGTFKVGAAPWPGLRFGLLTNNVNCIMCHATFDDAHRVYNTDAAQFGTFERCRVASLQQVDVRTQENVATTIAGTLYTSQQVDSSGRPLAGVGANTLFSSETGRALTASNLVPSGSWTTNSAAIAFDQIDSSGNIVQSSTGAPITRSSVTDAQSQATVTANQNLYLGYSGPVDGQIPATFPSIVPDENDSRTVDGTEWADATAGATGTLTVNANGVVAVVAGAQTSVTSLPVPSGPATTTFGSASGGSTDASVILVGTQANPIQLNGTVAFNGDVILEGYIEGTGNIIAKGNMYIVGDLIYNDAVGAGRTLGPDVPPGEGGANNGRTFGRAADGSTNAIAYSAGGSILVGNWIDDMGGRPYYGNVSGGTNMSGAMGSANANNGLQMSFAEAATFNRDEWAKTQPYLPATMPTPSTQTKTTTWVDSRGRTHTTTSTTTTGYSALPAPARGPSGNVYPDVTTGYAWAVNPDYTPGYVPRFYKQDDGSVYIAADLPPAQAAANPAQAAAYSSNGQANAQGSTEPHVGQPSLGAGQQGLTGYYYSPTQGGWVSANANDSNQADIPVPGWTSILQPAYLSQGGAPPVASLDPGAMVTPVTPAVLGLEPNAYGGVPWISEANLRALTNNAIAAHPAGKPLEIDGMLYTNNAIFTIAKAGDHTGGRLVVNGALVATDTGILGPTKLYVNYDKNVAPYLNIQDPTQVTLQTASIVEK